jgi:Ca-activated chloride channel family protein
MNFTAFRTNKQFLYATMGFLGGAFGAIIAEFVPNPSAGRENWLVVLPFNIALWSACFGAIITLFLFWAGELYRRKFWMDARMLIKAVLVGLISGALAGALAQTVYEFAPSEGFVKNVIIRIPCWGLLGALLGWRLGDVIPNLGTGRGILGGAIGGLVGGAGFVVVNQCLPDFAARVVGIGILGLSLGFCIVTTEKLLRAASLEVLWAPNESTTITLGTRPVYIGGGDDHIFISGLPEHSAQVVLENGKIDYIECTSGKRTNLKNGSRLKVGKVEVVVQSEG